MYKSFFGLTANPFNVNPDPRFLFRTRHTNEALACLAYGIQNRKGFMLMTGEVGTGKTTILNKLLDWLRSQRVKSAFIFNPKLDIVQFFDLMFSDLGIPCATRDKGQYILKLNQWLLERYRAKETAVLIVDEAQNLSLDMLEEIRLLTNLETSTEKLLQIVLSGQPELEVKLKASELRQLRQRITLRCRTYALSHEQMGAYITKRLKIAGASDVPIFSEDAVEAISRYSNGIPRVANLLCEHSLINAFVEQNRTISAHIVEDVAREFELDEVAPITPRAEYSRGDDIDINDAFRIFPAPRERRRAEETTVAGPEEQKR
jgi:general secretion pathway protein A